MNYNYGQSEVIWQIALLWEHLWSFSSFFRVVFVKPKDDKEWNGWRCPYIEEVRANKSRQMGERSKYFLRCLLIWIPLSHDDTHINFHPYT